MKKKTLLTIGCIICLIACSFLFASCNGKMKEMDKRLQTQIDKLNDSSKVELSKKNYPYVFTRINHNGSLIPFGDDQYWIRTVYANWYSLASKEDTTKKLSLEVVNDTLLIMRKATTFINVFNVDGIELRLMNYENPNATLLIKNTSGKKFAYVDRDQTVTGEPMVGELMFSISDTLTINTHADHHLIFYEFMNDGNQLKLKPKAGVHYLASLFHLRF